MKGGAMVRTNTFDYINVLQKAADASWLRNEAISNNIANVDTPGYKRQDVDFESVLERELGLNRYQTMDEKVGGVNTRRLSVGTYTDAAGFSYRTDGNNVDIETENVYLAQNQLKYNGLINSISQEFQNLKAVMK
jgi:flagellar basal-body rod protein FlgB